MTLSTIGAKLLTETAYTCIFLKETESIVPRENCYKFTVHFNYKDKFLIQLKF